MVCKHLNFHVVSCSNYEQHNCCGLRSISGCQGAEILGRGSVLSVGSDDVRSKYSCNYNNYSGFKVKGNYLHVRYIFSSSRFYGKFSYLNYKIFDTSDSRYINRQRFFELKSCQPSKRPLCWSDPYLWIHEFRIKNHDVYVTKSDEVVLIFEFMDLEIRITSIFGISLRKTSIGWFKSGVFTIRFFLSRQLRKSR